MDEIMEQFPIFGMQYALDKVVEAAIPWLPHLGAKRNKPGGHGFMARVIGDNIYKHSVVGLLTQLCPYFLHKSYHVNRPELFPSRLELNRQGHVAIATWYIKIIESMGIDLMHAVTETYTNNTSRSNLEDELFSLFSQSILPYCGFNILEHIGKLEVSDKASDLLLEPCVLIQLPWHPLLLHQWIVAGLLEVLLFEKESMELRHWPLPQQLVDIASELLSLVKNLKERLILGFGILSRMAHQHPKTDPALHGYLMDCVIAPSVPLLKFLTHGQAKASIKSIKILSWSKKSKVNSTPRSTVAPSCYQLDAHLADYYAKLPYNIFYWFLEELKFGNIFPNPDFDMKEAVERLQQHKNTMASGNVEVRRYMEFMTKVTPKVEKELIVKAAKGFIKGKVLDLKMLPSLTLPRFVKQIDTKEGLTQAGEFDNPDKNEEKHSLFRSLMLWGVGNGLLQNSENMNRNHVYQILYLQFLSVERENLIKFVGITGSMLDIQPVLEQVQCSKPLDLNSLQEMLKNTKEASMKMDRKQIFDGLAAEWKEPVILDIPCPEADSLSECEEVVKEFTLRTGRLIYNIATKCYEAVQNGGIPYPNRAVVQHLLPALHSILPQHFYTVCSPEIPWDPGCHFGPIFGDLFSANRESENFLELLHAVLSYYETDYKSWETDPTPKKHDIELPLVKLRTDMLQYGRYICYYRECIRIQMHAHFMFRTSRFNDLVFGFDHVNNVRSDWPLGIPYDGAVETWFQKCIDTALQHNVRHMIWIWELCCKTWNIPKPGTHLGKCPDLGHLYFACTLINELDLLMRMYIEESNGECAPEWAQKCLKLNLNWIFHRVIGAVIRADTESTEKLQYVADTMRPEVTNGYRLLKIFRKNMHTVKPLLFDDLMPNRDHPEINKAVQLFKANQLDELDKTMKFWEGRVFEVYV